MYLLDTNILSEFVQKRPSAQLLAKIRVQKQEDNHRRAPLSGSAVRLSSFIDQIHPPSLLRTDCFLAGLRLVEPTPRKKASALTRAG
jgi:hypothetical protein